VFSINDAGQSVGSSVEDGGAQRAVRWNADGSLTQLGTMGQPDPGYLPFHEGHGINKKGVVVGTALVGSAFRAFSWQAGVFTDLGLGNATHINDKGLVVGLAPGRIPVTWKRGTMRYLPGRDGGKRAYGHEVLGLNNLGDLVGYGPSPGVGVHDIAVLWRAGAATTLGHYPGGTHSVATGINDAGTIVGYGNLVDGGPMRALRWTVTGTQVQVDLAPLN
jgi:probable HAF family extracellular repeat protein